jgi:hypothetical protein
MRTIIAGSRSCSDYNELLRAIDKKEWEISVVLSGAAQGVDLLGEMWAIKNNKPLETYPAQWRKYGKSAGFLRNETMAQNADALIAIWDGKSKGTKHMIEKAKDHGLKVYVHII